VRDRGGAGDEGMARREGEMEGEVEESGPRRARGAARTGEEADWQRRGA